MLSAVSSALSELAVFGTRKREEFPAPLSHDKCPEAEVVGDKMLRDVPGRAKCSNRALTSWLALFLMCLFEMALGITSQLRYYLRHVYAKHGTPFHATHKVKQWNILCARLQQR